MKSRASRVALFTLIGGALFIYGAPGQAEPPGAAPAASPDDEPLVCSTSGSPFIDDLEDGDTSTLDGFGGWYEFDNEDEDPGSTLNEVTITPGGAGRSRFAARIAGSGYEYAGMGVTLGCSRDAGAFEGYRFAVKAGGTRSFDTKIATAATVLEENGGTCTGEGCNNHFFERVSLPDEGWHECTIRFCDLEQKDWPGPRVSFDPRTVMAVEFIATDVDQPFDITIDNVELTASVTRTGCVPIQRSPRAHGGHEHGGHEHHQH